MSRSGEELCRRLRAGLQIRSEIGDDGDLGCRYIRRSEMMARSWRACRDLR